MRLITCDPLPEADDDEALLLGALRERGLEARMHAWDGPDRVPEGAVCVLRSTWNYHLHLDEFLAWVATTARRAQLWNPEAVVRANVHKGYLARLERAGVPIVPTLFVPRGSRTGIAASLAGRPWNRVVVKPAVSASSFATQSFTASEWAEAERFLAPLALQRDMMIQQYMPAVESDEGERALVWIDGEFSHAVRKSPRFAQGVESTSGAQPLRPEETLLARAALAEVEGDLLYARVDVLRGPDGALRVAELELIEPSLFLCRHQGALQRLVEGIAREASRGEGTRRPGPSDRGSGPAGGSGEGGAERVRT